MGDQNKTLEEKWATWIIGLSITVFLICGAAIALWTLKRDMPIVQHKIVFAKDSLGNEIYSKSDVDSLISIVQNQERALSQKYQYVMEERAKEDSSKTLITFIVGVIISVCGFFGYKSFKDIKDHGAKIAENKAQEVAKNEITERLPDLLRQEMTNHYKDESLEVIEQRITQNLSNSFLTYIDTVVAEKVEDVKTEIFDDINNPAAPERAANEGADNTGNTGQATDPTAMFNG